MACRVICWLLVCQLIYVCFLSSYIRIPRVCLFVLFNGLLPCFFVTLFTVVCHVCFARLIDWLTDWLTDWFIDSLIHWFIDWLTDWWLIDWLTDWLTVWLTDWLFDWLTDRLIDWLIDWSIDGLRTCFVSLLGRLLPWQQALGHLDLSSRSSLPSSGAPSGMSFATKLKGVLHC